MELGFAAQPESHAGDRLREVNPGELLMRQLHLYTDERGKGEKKLYHVLS